MTSATIPRKRSLALTLRDLHSNISAFIAPVVVFYAISGSLQIFNLHESHGGYIAPKFVVSMAQLHKNQVLTPPPARPRRNDGLRAGGAPNGGPPGGGSGGERSTSPATLALKWLFLIEALGLAVTTVIGAWIGITLAKRRRTIVSLLVAGTALPIVLLML